ncbi:Uncharacterised protein [Metamycoplasma arthritidis]|uniref:Uncharacterized protein n=1 Tax=Metamycoplasma arthritidis (strain 158L3-1) TaxID=243272 RepID=B3PMD3_META1|nr:hypothetical protein [Metamycoplasma arthritidis]ACF07185.1 hypothetical protein MARTH_orf291 [Metamycoplasma arthritidis 158L3-1]VEU78709.1 Uncharacterised protein [Metamycoplasma arthritidis]
MTKKSRIFLWSSLATISVLAIGGTATAMYFHNKKAESKDAKDQNRLKKDNDIKNKKDSNKKESPKEEGPKLNPKDNDDNGGEGNDIEEEPKYKTIPSSEIFPLVNSLDYYDKLNFRNGQAWIDEDMIAFIIKDIVSRMTITYGKIKYSYKVISDQEVLISFIWYSQEKYEKSFRTYRIFVNKV